MSAVLAEVWRGPLVELRHRGAVAVADATGRLWLAAGDPELVTFWRSAAKPFQAAALVVTGAADRYGLDDRHLAVACASHNGEEVHRAAVVDLLDRAGFGPDALRCGTAPPLDRREAEALVRQGLRPGPVHHMCSGKHAGMLAVCRHRGWDPASYPDPAHPLQRLLRELVAAAAGVEPAAVPLAPDGCGVPTFGLSLRAMATAYARLADPGGAWAAAVPGLGTALARVGAAMVAEPYLVGGRDRLCTELMQAFGGGLLAKSGAAGVYCLGLAPERVAACPPLAGARGGVGVAIKVEDGHGGARDAVAVDVLAQLGLLDRLPGEVAARLEERRSPAVSTAAGPAGRLRVVARLRPPGS